MKDDYKIQMAPGVRVKVRPVWPLGALPFEGRVKTWNSNGDVVEVVDSDGEIHRWGPLEALTYDEANMQVYLHERDSSWVFLVLDQEDDQ